ncbi:MAG: nucleotidyltransferase family protein [Pseudomonadota bacterium]|nr:nucleotidyltransferase family protein [Pseudomonadota bacterium]
MTKVEGAIERTLFSLLNQAPALDLPEVLAAPELLPFLDKNGVAGTFYHALRKSGWKEPLPGGVYEALRGRFNSQIARNMACAAAARETFRLLHREGIPFLVLKGLALAENVYPHFGMRTTSDLDVLIRREDLLRADAALGGAGYHARDSTPRRALLNPPGYLASLEFHRPGSVFSYLHLHWHLVNTSVPAFGFIENIDMERIWNRSRTGLVACAEARLLGPEHLIIYLCEHGLRVGHSFDRLNLICDLYYAIKNPGAPLDWDLAAAEAKELGLRNFVYLGLRIVQAYGGKALLDDATMEKFAPPSLSVWERLFLAMQLHGLRLRGSSFLVYLAASKGAFGKGRLILRTLFPPRPILAQRSWRWADAHPTTLYFRRIGETMTVLIRLARRLARQPARRSNL